MGYFGRQQAERAQAFSLPELFLGVHNFFVQLGVGNGNGREVGQGGQDMDVLGGIPIRCAAVHAQRTDDGCPDAHRDRKQRDQSVLPRQLNMPVRIVVLHIINLDRFAAPDHCPNEAIANRNRWFGQIIRARTVAGPEF